MYLGFTGIITFPPKKSDPAAQEALLEVVKKAPLDRILLETDAPYLAPGKYRGKRSEPWMVNEVARKIAEIKQIDCDEIVKITTENAKKLFNLVF
jgi:TatD DNase family protein